MVAVLLAAGFILAREVVPGVSSALWIGLALAWTCAGALLRGAACRGALACAVVLSAAGWWTLRIDEGSATSLARLAATEGPATLEGIIAEEPRSAEPARGALGMYSTDPPATEVELEVVGVVDHAGDVRRASGRVRVRIDEELSERPEWARAGALVRVGGMLTGVRGPRNPGEPDWRDWAAQGGIAGDLDAPGWALMAPAENGDIFARIRGLWAEWTGALHARAVRGLGLDAPPGPGDRPEARALLGALLLGERDADLRSVNSAFQRLGLIHLVAISGFNLAVMAGVAMFLLRLPGERGWLEPAVIALLVAGYMLVLPAQTPILRAGVMVLALLLTEALGRRYDRVSVLGWVAVIMLLYKPLDAWSLGFQLSFGIVGVLLLWGDEVNGRMFGVPLRGLVRPTVAPGRPGALWWLPALGRWCVRALQAQVSASVLAWAVATPVILYHTGMFSPLAFATTIIVLPFTIIVLWVGYIALLVGVLIPAAGGASGWVLERLAALLVDVVLWIDGLPAMSLRLPAISLLWTIAGIGVVVYWVRRGHVRDRRAWGLTGALLVWAAAEIVIGPRWAARWPLRMDALAVGEGTCVLLRSHGHTMMWDCGSRSTGIGERRVPDAVRALGAWRVRTIVVAGLGLEHVSGVLDVVGPLGVERVLVTEQFRRAARADGAGPEARMIDEVTRRGVRVETLLPNDELLLGAARLRLVSPAPEAVFSNAFDTSMVARIEVEGVPGEPSVLFTSDVGERVLVGISDGEARAEVVFPPRNGAYSPAAAEFLGRTRARLVVQSGSAGLDDPRWEHVRAGRTWMATGDLGAIGVIIDASGEVRARPLIGDAQNDGFIRGFR